MHPLLVFLLFGINLLKSQIILPSNVADTTLTVANSPYIVNNYITFSGHVTIENGVQIILIGSYFISILGSLNCGCNDLSILNNNTKGLSNNITYIHIIGNASAPMSWGLFINQANTDPPPNIQFCNTVFENMITGIITTNVQYAPYTIHNCEFKTVNVAIKHSTDTTNKIYDSYFHGLNSVYEAYDNNIIGTGGVIFDNCLFDTFGRFSHDTTKSVNIAIRNSEIYGDGLRACLNIDSITGDSKYAIYNNIISNCKDGIELLSAAVSVRNNTITNCSRYGINAYNTTGYFDISYNSFGNNGIYDIMVNNIQNVEIMDNIFTPNYNQNATIYAVDIDYITITNSQFISLNHDNILLFNYVDNIHITQNNFIGNDNKYGTIMVNMSDNISISDNNFIGNVGKYLFHLTNGMDLYLNDNNISNNTMSNDLVYVSNIQSIQIHFNSYNNNKLRQIISVQNANYVYITNNIIHNNYVHDNTNIINTFILSDMNDNIYIEHNKFHNNGILQSNTDFMLIYFINNTIMSIKYNTFQNAINTANILHFNYMDDIDKAYISNNNFIQTSPNLISYINCHAGSIYFKPKIFISLNNFYNITNINYFISTNDVYINANNNYYSGLRSYTNIKQYINPSTICQINITNAIEQPISTNTVNNKCYWKFTESNCNSGEIINTHCDSDTPLPTQYTSTPTYPPSLLPSISPTSTPIPLSISPTLSTITPTQLIIEVTTRSTLQPTINEKPIDTGEVILSTSLDDIRPYKIATADDSSFMIMAGSAGITLVFLIFAGILLYVFLKLSKLKKETAHLNKQMNKNTTCDLSGGDYGRKSIGLDAIGNEIYAHNKNFNISMAAGDDDIDAVINAMNMNLTGINDDINSRKTSKISINNDIRHKKSSLLTIASLQNRKKSSLKSDGHTPRPPPRKSHTYQPRLMHMNNINAVIGLEEEKDVIDTDRDNSSAMYINYHHNPIVEIEGNETQGYRIESLDSEDYNDNMVMNAINTSMPNIGELSVTAKHSFSKTLVKTPGLYNQKSNSNLHSNLQNHKKSNSNFLLKIDIPIVDELGIKVNHNHDDEIIVIEDANDNETNLSELLSEEETSESSRSFTIKSQEEHKMNITLEVADIDVNGNSINSNSNMKNNIKCGYIGLTSPTDTTINTATPPTPQMDPDQILHSLEFRHKLIKQQEIKQKQKQQYLQQQHVQQPGTPQGGVKLPKPKTKGHWM